MDKFPMIDVPSQVHYIVGAVVLIIGIIGCIGNAVVMFAFCRYIYIENELDYNTCACCHLHSAYTIHYTYNDQKYWDSAANPPKQCMHSVCVHIAKHEPVISTLHSRFGCNTMRRTLPSIFCLSTSLAILLCLFEIGFQSGTHTRLSMSDGCLRAAQDDIEGLSSDGDPKESWGF